MDKQRKAQIKKYILWAGLALLVLLLSVMPLIASENAQEDGPQASILTDTVVRRDIETQLIGGGQLASSHSEEITIPEAVKLTEYLVKNGDTVLEGDPIARVDKVSVMLALEEVQETLDHLSEEMADISKDTEATEVIAQAGGLVKILYAGKGDSVRDVMLEHGALAVLSLDGRMAAEFPCETTLGGGDSITVTLSDGTAVKGRVESNIGGILTVSMEDQGYAVGETVTVCDTDGNKLGSSTLFIHSPWNATAYSGTVSAVNAKEGDRLAAGKRLFQLENNGHSSAFQILVSQRQEYEELMNTLFTMYNTGYVTAPCNGIVTGVDTEGAFLLAATGEEPGWFVQLLSREIPGESGETPPPESSEPTEPSDPTDPSEDPSTPVYTVYVGQVLDAAGTVALHPIIYSGITDLGSVSTTVSIGGGSDVWPLSGLYNRDLVTPYPGTATVGNILFKVIDQDGKVSFVFAAVAGASQQIPSFSFGGFGGFAGAAAPAFEPYSLETLTVATVTSQEKMTLEITVDQQDIAGLASGQSASITVEALTGHSFPATITSVSNTGTNAGGSSKFTLKLTLDKSGDMLPGMHASAYLTRDAQKDVLTVPAAALVEQGAKTLIYTGYNEKEETLLNPVEVTTGASDGEYVQILSGLSEGDSFFYAYYDTLEISNIPDAGVFGF